MFGHWLKFAAFCFVFFGIVLFCVVVGGYTSFWRAQNRIETSKSFLTDACQKRLDLLPRLIEIAEKSKTETTISRIDQTGQKAKNILQQVTAQNLLLDNGLVKEFEIYQSKLTFQLKELFTQMEVSLDNNYSKQFLSLKKLFFTAQDNLFVTKKKYNEEVNYFNIRAAAFPTILIAKLFGFNKIIYIEISKDLFLPAQITFSKKIS